MDQQRLHLSSVQRFGHTNTNTSSNANADCDTNGDSDCHTNGNSDRYPDCNSNGYADGNSNSYAHRNSNGYADRYPERDSNTNGFHANHHPERRYVYQSCDRAALVRYGRSDDLLHDERHNSDDELDPLQRQLHADRKSHV